jgi:GDSL-like Lipase/Acylhydrolase family
MAKLTALTEITAVENTDVAMFVDVSDTSSDTAGTSKKITWGNVKTSLAETTPLTTIDNADYVMSVDVSDTTMSASGTNKKITFSDFKSALNISSSIVGVGVLSGVNYTTTFTPTTSPVSGTEFTFIPDTNNPAGATLNGVFIKQASGTTLNDLEANDLIAGGYYKMRFNGTNYVLLGTSASASSVPTATKIAIIGDSHSRNVMGQEPVLLPLGARALPAIGGFNSTGLIVSGYSEATIPASTACNIRFDGTNLYCTIGTDAESVAVPIVNGSKKGGYMTLVGGAGTHVGKKIVVYVRQRFVATTSSGNIGITLGSGTPQTPHVNNQAFDSWLSFLFARNGWHSYNVTNYAVSGNSTYDMLSGDTADMIALAPKYLFLMGGYNDNSDETFTTLGSGIPATGSPATNIISIVTQALDAGITPIVAAPLFVVSQITSSARGYYGQLQIYARLRKAFRDNPRVFFVEPTQAILNQNNYTVIAGSGNAVAQPTVAGLAKYFKPDIVHPNLFGAWTMYNFISNLLTDTGIPLRRALPSHLGERTISSLTDGPYVTAYGGVPKTNILGLMSIFATPFKHFAGTGGGSLTAGAVPGDWSLNVAGTTPTTLRLYPSDNVNAGTHPDNLTQKGMRYEVVAGAGTGIITLTPVASNYIPDDIGGAAVMSGKRARAFFQFRMTNMALFDNLTVRISFVGSTSLDVYLTTFDTNSRLLSGDTIADTGLLTLTSPEFTIPTSITGINPRIAFAVNATGTVNLDVFRFDVELID